MNGTLFVFIRNAALMFISNAGRPPCASSRKSTAQKSRIRVTGS